MPRDCPELLHIANVPSLLPGNLARHLPPVRDWPVQTALSERKRSSRLRDERDGRQVLVFVFARTIVSLRDTTKIMIFAFILVFFTNG